MILNDCVVFYHASPVPNLKKVVPTKDIKNNHNGRVPGMKYACLASSPTQAFYWANALRNRNRSKQWYIYQVRLEHQTIVEDCQGGYHFEGSGRITEAINVNDHEKMDGEVNVFSPVPVTGLYATVKF
ncbi:hypothetical protein NST12_16545 [Bacillus sp. FSL W8-1127]|uniref:hypothetical protein n=1 Tax=Bacillus sp. FSL W8-1127 TaxID=2954710 RepID=UPI0030F7F6C6